MNNKTCSKCRYLLHKDTFEVCTHSMTETSMFDKACEHFAPPTNGDKIRQMSDEELAKFLSMCGCKYCTYSGFDGVAMYYCRKTENRHCDVGIEAWLNAPAESEGKDE